ncbi:MAG: alkaline phosphatase [Abitibacteriaceae bacterium]|nr:alkaline phosphatase [Abditibacteriaceae bacterium]
MRKTITTCAMLFMTLTIIALQVARAAPRQVVVVVADGLSPQVMELGTNYVKYPADEGNTSAFDTLTAKAKAQPAGAASLDALKGVLKNAAASGYKTGLVTTNDVTRDAGTLYDAAGADAKSLLNNPQFDFLGGGGRQNFGADVVQGFKQGGNSAVMDVDTLQAADQDVKGRVLALQSDDALSYALDRNAGEQGGLSDLAALAIESLGKNNSPFLLVIHDSLISKALDAKDTPAVAGEFRELDGIINNVLGAQEDNTNLALAVLATGGTTAPHLAGATPAERANTFFILSGLPMSFAGAGNTLKGANDEAITNFITDEYKDWKLTPETRAAIIGGTTTPEAAIRAAYEPALQVNYEQANAQPMAYTVGLDIQGDLVQTLNNWANTKPGG